MQPVRLNPESKRGSEHDKHTQGQEYLKVRQLNNREGTRTHLDLVGPTNGEDYPAVSADTALH